MIASRNLEVTLVIKYYFYNYKHLKYYISDLIYFGLMPHKRDPEVEIVNNGFQGCMKHLQVKNPHDHKIL